MRILFVSLLSACFIGFQSLSVAGQPNNGDLDGLLKTVKQKDNVDARIQAIVALADFGPKAAPALPDLLDALQTKNEDLRLNAAITLAKIGKPAIAPVAKLLQSDDADTQFYATWTIGWIGPEAKETTPTIIKLMSAKNEGIRRKAAFALGRLAADPAKTIDVLVGAFKDESPEVRQAAGDALAKIGKAAVRPLIDLLKSDSIEAQMQASISLGEIGPDAVDAVPVLKDRYLSNAKHNPYHYAQILAKMGKAGVPALALGFKDARADVRGAASQALQQMGADAVGVLIDGLGDKKVEVRRLAAQTLFPMRIGDKSVVIALGFGLGDEDDQVRQSCVSGLQQLGALAKPASAKLKVALTDMNPNVRQQAYFILQQVGDDPRPTLTKALLSKNDKVRINAASLMVAVGHDINAAVPVLETALKNDDLGLKMQAAFTLSQRQLQKDKVLPIFLDGLKHKSAGVRLQAVQGINMFGPSAASAAPQLARMLGDSDANVRQTSIYALQHVRGKPEEIIPILAKFFKDGNPDARRSILQTVHVYADKGMDIVIDGLKDKDASVRQQAIYSLQNVRGTPEKMVPILTTVFKNGDVETKRAILQIAYIYREKSLDLILSGLREKEDRVRQQAIWALQNVRGDPDTVVPVLTSIFKDGDANTRRIIMQISHIYGAKMKHLVMDGLKDKDTSVRQQSVFAALNFPGDLTEILPAIIAIVNDKDAGFSRHQAVGLLSRTGEAGVPTLGDLLKDKDVNVRFQAAQILRNFGAKSAKALPAIKEAINDSNPTIRANCMYLVAVIGNDGPEFLVKQYALAKDAGTRASLLQTLVQANQKKLVLPLLKSAMKDESPQVRQATVFLLSNFGSDSKEGFEAFKVGLKDTDATVHRNAALLGSYFGQKSHAPLEEALKGTKDSNFRVTILQSLVNSDYRSKTGIAPLIDCLKDKNPMPRQHACSLLGRIGPDAADAVPVLRKLADDASNQNVQREAQTALKRIESR